MRPASGSVRGCTAGDPAKLELQAASLVQYGAQGCLGDVTATAVDASGNPSAPPKAYEVTLRPQASAPDGAGAAAKVTAKGSNRCKLREGAVAFRDVQLAAEGQGLFELVAYCKSRPVVRPWSAALQAACMGIMQWQLFWLWLPLC